MQFSSYFYTSLAATVAIAAHAVITREQFYPIILFLVTSKVSFVVLSNMAIAAILLIGRISQYIFLGALRDVEVEQLVERSKYTITETCLALAVFRNELSPPILALFGVLLFLKAFHWLSKLRIDYLEQIMPVATSTHVRLISLICLLFVCDLWAANGCIQYTIQNQKSVLILFGFEFGLLVISVANLICRYILNIVDSRMANGLVSKGLCVMLIDLICDAFRILTYFGFFYVVLVNYGVPIHIIREMSIAFHTFHRKLSSFIRYVKLTKNLDHRLENATREEITAAGDCLICREAMDTAKKLPCGHVFHLDCLRMWLQHQQSCPLCRAEIPVNPTPADLAREAAMNRANTAEGAVEENPVLEEVRRLAEAVQGHQNRAGSSRESDADGDSNNLPCFFRVTGNCAVDVRTAPNNSSPCVRSLNEGTVIFVTKRIEGHQEADSVWLQVPDGYVRERGILFGALGPPSVVPFDAAHHLPKSQTAAAHAKRLQAFEELVPQPAVSAVKCSQLSSNGKYGDSAASTRAPGDTSRVTRKRSVEDELLSKVAEEIFTSTFRNSDNINVNGEANDTDRASEDLLWIDDEVATHATAAAKLMRSAFGDPVKNRADGSGKRDFKGVGAGWGVGTSLDKMITMQAQMEHFATSLEGMHDTVTTCQVVLSQLVDDQVKQYQKIHELRRAVAGKSTGGSAPGDYFFEFSCGRGGSSSGSSFPSVPTDPSPTLESDVILKSVKSGEVNVDGLSTSRRDDVEMSIQSSSQKAETIAAVDIKIEVEDMLEHSSGAALYERLLSSGGFTSVVDDDEDEDEKISTEETVQRGSGMGVTECNDITAGLTSEESPHDNNSESKHIPADNVESLKVAEAAKAADAMREIKELLASKYRAKTLEDKEQGKSSADG